MNTELLDQLTLMQDALNEYITTDWQQNRTEMDFMVASHQEMSELIDSSSTDEEGNTHSIGWKWWKGKTPTVRTMDVLDWDELHPSVTDNIKIELTDLVFFTLSQKILEDFTNPGEEAEIHCCNDWVNLMRITLNNLLQKPGCALQIILILAEKLNFNVAAYYVAKHLLNYYRQISNYGDGYEKIKNGKEDNELLHDIIADITPEQMGDDFEKSYDLIADRFFKIFNAPKDKEITYSFWTDIIDNR